MYFFFCGARYKTRFNFHLSVFYHFLFIFFQPERDSMFLRHLPFLKAVFLYSFTAFGGPLGHMGMMVRFFVQKRKDITEEELLEYNAFCQMLPGPSSTQTVMLIAMKRGGIPLALVTLLLWIFPAALIMSCLSFLLYYFDIKNIQTKLFIYILPMSIGFIFFAAARMMRSSVKHLATTLIMIGSIIATVAIKSPWVFPGLLLVSGFISNFSDKRIPDSHEKPKPIKWVNLWLFAALFILAGLFSELALVHNWPHRRLFNIFENFYRFGSIVFGGGQALLPMMLYQFVNRQMRLGHAPYLTSEQLLTGYGMVQAVPGPVFSVCSFVGGMAMAGGGHSGFFWQMMGCIVATVGVFLPSTLLLFFFYPIYQNLKHHVIIYRSLEGINAAVVGIIWASGFILFRTLMLDSNSIGFDAFSLNAWSNLVVVIITFSLLYFTKIPSPLIVLGWLLMGWAINL